MVRTEISLFLKNRPGELGKISTLLPKPASISTPSQSRMRPASSRSFFRARGKSLKRIASAAGYNSMRKDSAEYALIRLPPANGKINAALDPLPPNDYFFDIRRWSPDGSFHRISHRRAYRMSSGPSTESTVN